MANGSNPWRVSYDLQPLANLFWPTCLLTTLITALLLSITPANAEIPSFGPTEELRKARFVYLEALDFEQLYFEAHKKREAELDSARTELQKAKQRLSQRNATFAENLERNRKIAEALNRYESRIARYDRFIRNRTRQYDEALQKLAKLRDSGFAKTAEDDVEIARLEANVANHKEYIERAGQVRDNLKNARKAFLANPINRQQPIEDLTPLMNAVFSARTKLGEAERQFAVQAERLAKSQAAAKTATLDYFKRLEQARPPFVQRVQIRHKKRLIYDGEWIVQEKTSGIEAYRPALEEILANRKQVLALSDARIEYLERSRSQLREKMNDMRRFNQLRQFELSTEEILQSFASAGLEIAIVVADISVSGGVVTIVSYGFGKAASEAAGALSTKSAITWFRSTESREISAALGTAIATVTGKQFEDAINKTYEQRGYQGATAVTISEATEASVGAVVSKALVAGGEALYELYEPGADAAAKAASRSIVSEIAGEQATEKLLQNIDDAGRLAAISTLAAEIGGKIIIDATLGANVSRLQRELVEEQAKTHLVQRFWNEAHSALLAERRRNIVVRAEIEALELRLAGKSIGYSLKRHVDEPLDIKDLAGAHGLDIEFSVSEALEAAPSVLVQGAEKSAFKRNPKSNFENAWKGEVVLDEDNLSGLDEWKIGFALDRQKHLPYWDFDADPASFAEIGDLKAPSLSGFEPGIDRHHRLRLKSEKIETVMILDMLYQDPGTCTRHMVMGDKQYRAKVSPSAEFLDSERAGAMSPPLPSEVQFCLGSDKKIKTDEAGRALAFLKGACSPECWPTSNGYVPKSIEDIAEIQNSPETLIPDLNGQDIANPLPVLPKPGSLSVDDLFEREN